jgi:hypothetical protein
VRPRKDFRRPILQPAQQLKQEGILPGRRLSNRAGSAGAYIRGKCGGCKPIPDQNVLTGRTAVATLGADCIRISSPEGLCRSIVWGWQELSFKVSFRAVLMPVVMGLATAPVHASLDCQPVDYLTAPLRAPSGAPAIDALVMAYPDITVAPEGNSVSLDGEDWLEIGAVSDRDPSERLRSPTVSEQFIHVYPLDFDLDARKVPFFDPGRLRNNRLFAGLYFEREADASRTLVPVSLAGLADGAYMVTSHRNVDCQLAAVLEALRQSRADFSPYFEGNGGGFNWRRIAGTERLSAHSYGIAVDLNASLGGYWLWAGEREGAVGEFPNRIPEELVRAFERYGFIWGGKWHHYDGMHFEYRPELILYSRILGETER